MDSKNKICPSCGMQVDPGENFCTVCGTRVVAEATPVAPEAPVSAQASNPPVSDYGTQSAASADTAAPASAVPPQPAASADPAAPVYTPPQAPTYGAPQGQPPVYGQQPPAYNAQQGQPPIYGQQPPAGAPAYGTPAGGAPSSTAPGYYGAQPTQPPKKKSPAPAIAISSIIIIAIIGIIIFMFAGNSSAKKEYEELANNILASSTASEVASYRRTLDSFADENSGVVDDELINFVQLCDVYDNAGDSETKFENMLTNLRTYTSSTSADIADCAAKVYANVESDYDAFTAAQAQGGGSTEGGDFDITTFASSLVITGDPAFTTRGGDRGFSFNATNTADKDIVYFEVWVFCYDEYGNPVYDDYGYNWDWVVDEEGLEAGASHTPDENGYWRLNFEGAEHLYFYVNYVEFADGSTEGISDLNGYNEYQIFAALDYINDLADEWAAQQAW